MTRWRRSRILLVTALSYRRVTTGDYMPQTPAAALIRLWRDLAHETAFQALIAAPLTLLGVFWPAPGSSEAAADA